MDGNNLKVCFNGKDKRLFVIIFYVLTFAIITICLIHRCKFTLSATSGDELSQSATVVRYLYGDRPILDNWTASTMFSAFVMGQICKLIGIYKLPVLTARYLYILYQVIIAIAIVILAPRKNMTSLWASLGYLCSTPYNINRITYNTLSIGLFILFGVLFFGGLYPDDNLDSENSIRCRTKVLFSGVVFALSVLSIPHNALLYFAYVVVVVLLVIRRKNAVGIFSINRLLFLTLGILLVAIPFIVYLLVNGTVSEYVNNLQFILSDAEYSKGLWVKFIESQHRIVRIYWRVWVPLAVLDIFLFLFRNKNEKLLDLAFFLGNLVIIYGIVRFSFIYGSVSINLAIPPILFLGIQSIAISSFKGKSCENGYDYKVCVVWLVAGYLFYICEYLATDTEILSSSAALICVVVPALLLNYGSMTKTRENVVTKTAFYLTALSFVVCLFILRMTYVWGDEPISDLDVRVDSGMASGIYTSQDSADYFLNCEAIVASADIDANDQALILPMNPIYYYLLNAKCASPYIFRFEVSIEELNNYYDLHPEKIPTVVVACKNDDSGNEYDIDECLEYFENMTDMGYYVYYNSDDAIVLKR